jgi:hypothetical protein
MTAHPRSEVLQPLRAEGRDVDFRMRQREAEGEQDPVAGIAGDQ